LAGSSSLEQELLAAESGMTPYGGAPIAELYASTTVLFADIAGFTAWSSARSPSEVFTLLETLYSAFDAIAKRRGVFKVETIGDSYVAVCGLPQPRKNHAVIMARFARDCRSRMAELTRELESILGPGTAELSMRFGLNSGPTTAGVLRGEKSRFQLFGDTVNTAARIEGKGEKNRIHCSQTTADLIIKAGKEHWIKPREDLIEAKGKGKMQTFWIEPTSGPLSQSENTISSGMEHSETSDRDSDLLAAQDTAKIERMVAWNVDLLSQLLRRMIARRNDLGLERKRSFDVIIKKLEEDSASGRSLVLDEVAEVIHLPKVKLETNEPTDPASIELSYDVVDQLRHFIHTIAAMYNDNPFHNFEHASHVTMSVFKLLSRIVSSEEDAYGINSDPLTQFAVVLSALIHDADHPGTFEEVFEAHRFIKSLY